MAKDYSVRGAGYHWFDTGQTRGTTTSSGVFTITSSFPGKVFTGMAWDDASALRSTQTGGGPAQTQGTFYYFVPLTPSKTTARFRVLRYVTSSASISSFTLASSTSAVTAKYILIGR